MLSSPISRRNFVLAAATVLLLIFATLVADATQAQPSEHLIPRTGASVVTTTALGGTSV